MKDLATPVTGSCLCGGVQYRVRKFLRDVVACHCSQCRKSSGHYVAATKANNSDLEMISEETLTWYRSSEVAERGFCSRCGSSLFWRRIGADATSIMAGALDAPTGLETVAHIFVDDQSDYHTIGDDVPLYPEYD